MSLLTLILLHYTSYICWCCSRPNHCVAGLLLSQQTLVLLLERVHACCSQTCLLCYKHPDAAAQVFVSCCILCLFNCFKHPSCDMCLARCCQQTDCVQMYISQNCLILPCGM